MSADGLTDRTMVCCVALLLLEFGSPSLPKTVAVLVMSPGAAGAVTAMVSGVLAAFARFPTVQVTTSPAGTQLGLDKPELNVTPVGRLSVTITPVAGFGPLFVTVTVYVSVAFTVTGSGASVLVKDKSVGGPPLSKMETLLPLPLFATAKSGFPSRLKSPIAAEYDTPPTVAKFVAAPKAPPPVPNKTATVIVLPLPVRARSGLPSRLRSPIATEYWAACAAKVVGAAKEPVPLPNKMLTPLPP